MTATIAAIPATTIEARPTFGIFTNTATATAIMMMPVTTRSQIEASPPRQFSVQQFGALFGGLIISGCDFAHERGDLPKHLFAPCGEQSIEAVKRSRVR